MGAAGATRENTGSHSCPNWLFGIRNLDSILDPSLGETTGSHARNRPNIRLPRATRRSNGGVAVRPSTLDSICGALEVWCPCTFLGPNVFSDLTRPSCESDG